MCFYLSSLFWLIFRQTVNPLLLKCKFFFQFASGQLHGLISKDTYLFKSRSLNLGLKVSAIKQQTKHSIHSPSPDVKWHLHLAIYWDNTSNIIAFPYPKFHFLQFQLLTVKWSRNTKWKITE